jgi:hypothetical protein
MKPPSLRILKIQHPASVSEIRTRLLRLVQAYEFSEFPTEVPLEIARQRIDDLFGDSKNPDDLYLVTLNSDGKSDPFDFVRRLLNVCDNPVVAVPSDNMAAGVKLRWRDPGLRDLRDTLCLVQMESVQNTRELIMMLRGYVRYCKENPRSKCVQTNLGIQTQKEAHRPQVAPVDRRMLRPSSVTDTGLIVSRGQFERIPDLDDEIRVTKTGIIDVISDKADKGFARKLKAVK